MRHHRYSLTMDLEHLIDNYDEKWRVDHCGASAIRDYLAAQQDLDATDTDLLVGLIDRDIERHWIAFRRYMEVEKDHASLDKVLTRFRAIPSFYDYRLLFPSSAAFECCSARLANLELMTRNTHGDAISPTFYRERHGFDVADVAPTIENYVAVEDDDPAEGKPMLRLLGLRGCSQLGRQTSTEPDAFVKTELAEGNRIVIARKQEKEISRQHLAVQLLTPVHAVVTNASSVNSVAVLLRHVLIPHTLPPRASIICRFPFSIEVVRRRIHLGRAPSSAPQPPLFEDEDGE